MGAMQVTMIDENKYAETMTDVVLPALEQCCEEGWFDPSAAERSAGIEPLSGIMDTGGRSGQLHYLCYDSAKFDAIREQGATATFRGAIVISHGFTEFAEKYDELVWYFLLAGYSVCVLEHRGHGKSARDVDNRCMVWIDDWQRYVADLAGFAETIGQQYAAGMPLNLFCHSMGGGIGAAVMEHYPSLFDKAVLSAPMIAPVVGMPTWIARIATGALCGLGFGKARVFGHTDFSPELDLDEHKGASEARVRWFHKQRVDDVACQTNAATFEWAHQAMALSRAVLKPDMCGAIETPTLLFQAGRDVWVLNGPQDDFVERVREGGGLIEKIRYGKSLHEIFSMPNTVVGPYVNKILDFLSAPADSL